VSTLERLATILHRDFQIAREALVPDATLESLEIDSLRMIEILFVVEEEFGVSAPEDVAQLRESVRTLGELAAYIDSLARSTAAKT
jgi:acyl carrier protein